MIPHPCHDCEGLGRKKTNKTLEVKVPAGIDDGMRIRLSGKGEPGVNGGPAGDLYVEVHLKEHAVFQRDGDDLHCEMPVSFAAAALGGTIEVPLWEVKRHLIFLKVRKQVKHSVCVARASRVCVHPTLVICSAILWWKRRCVCLSVKKNC